MIDMEKDIPVPKQRWKTNETKVHKGVPIYIILFNINNFGMRDSTKDHLFGF